MEKVKTIKALLNLAKNSDSTAIEAVLYEGKDNKGNDALYGDGYTLAYSRGHIYGDNSSQPVLWIVRKKDKRLIFYIDAPYTRRLPKRVTNKFKSISHYQVKTQWEKIPEIYNQELVDLLAEAGETEALKALIKFLR